VRLLLSGFLLLAAQGFAQTAPPRAFELASVKPAADSNPYHWNAVPGTLRMRGINLRQIIQAAYSVQDFQVERGSGWADTERFDIDAKADHPADRDEMLLMLRTLLAERFRLKMANKPRRVEGYTMVLTKGGLKIQEDPSEGSPAASVNTGRMTITRFPMGGIAHALSSILELPVEDRTGLSGQYSFSLQWTPQNRVTMGSADGLTLAASLPEALEAKIGIRLERGKVEIPVYIIEHAERPTEN